MKTLELELQKKLLIMEIPENTEAYYKKEITYTISDKQSEFSLLPKGEYKLICKGSELTEEIAKDFVKNMIDNSEINFLYKNHRKNEKGFVFSALESFNSAIEAQGYYWGEVPWDFPLVEEYGYQISSSPDVERGWMYEEGESKYFEALKKYEEAESKTFNLAKTLIFEIL